MAELICYNRGCSKKFTDNSDDSCQYHPGAPVFHDAYKGWSCCEKRSIDFTEFLNIPGCSKGRHNPTKPEPIPKKVQETNIDDVINESAPKMFQKAPDVVLERPSNDIQKIELKTIIAGSLKTALAQHKKKLQEKVALSKNTVSDVIQAGASCKNNACTAKYVNEDSCNTSCEHHPGYPVFHEGYKFWSCCQKRTSDFDQFLKQTGCKAGEHEWMKPSEITQKKSTCRYDWHQTGKYTIISIYSKLCDPERCSVQVNPTCINAVISFTGGVDTFELQLELNGVIEPEASSVEYMGTKAEIKLKKRDPFSWSKLEYSPK